jgi:hypothetical protein
MNTAKLNDWMQVVGIFALVVSLLFVGFQLKQDREIAKVEIYQSRASTVAETLTAAASNSDAMSAWAKTMVGDPGEEIRMNGWAGPISTREFLLAHMQSQSFLALADNSYFQYEKGYLPEDHWLSVRATLKNSLSGIPVFRSVLEMNLTGFRPGFRDELLKITAEIDQEK